MDERADQLCKPLPCGSELDAWDCFVKWVSFREKSERACFFARRGFRRRSQSVVGRCERGVQKKPFQWALERFFVSDQEVEVGPVRICAASYATSPDKLTPDCLR